MAKEPAGKPRITGESDPEELLWSRALGGDPEAAHYLVALVESNYRDRITGRMKSLHTGAHTHTIEDVFQDTIIRLMERLKAGEYKDLPADDRLDMLKFFQRACDGRLRDEVRERLSPVLSRRKEEVPDDIADENARIPGDPGHTEHLALVHEAIAGLGPEHENLMRLVVSGMSYEELSRKTGKKEDAVRQLVCRLKNEMRQAIIPKSATAQLKYEAEQAKERRWPSRSEIEAAVAVLPPGIKEAAIFVHIERRPVEELAKELGDRGFEKARSRLKLAYQTLSGKLKVPFPQAFEKSTP